ncbi:MAG: PilZ domain-containing protein [Acidobacteriia bacterium]|nr:PilZ domain-containing protein [Terriglobia bacterium]
MALGRGILKSERRRRVRPEFAGAVILCWTDDRGRDHYGSGRCMNISETGCSIELTESVPVRANVSLRVPDLDLSAFASVRHVTRKGMKFNIGLEFGQPVRLRLADAESAATIQL